MISQTSMYALQAVLLLAQRGHEEAVPAHLIAEDLGVPSNYLSKTLSRLAREGILDSSRGPNGGYRLTRDPVALSVAHVVRPFQQLTMDGTCLLSGDDCDPDDPCVAHRSWARLTEATVAALEATTVAQLLDRSPARTQRHAQPTSENNR